MDFIHIDDAHHRVLLFNKPSSTTSDVPGSHKDSLIDPIRRLHAIERSNYTHTNRILPSVSFALNVENHRLSHLIFRRYNIPSIISGLLCQFSFKTLILQHTFNDLFELSW